MSEQSFLAGKHRHHGNIAERMVHGLQQVMEHALDAEAISATPGLLQQLDPRIKLLSLLAVLAATLLASQLTTLLLLFVLAVVLALASQISLSRLYRQAWLSVLLFSGMLALPAIFMVPGERLLTLPLLHWHITRQGLSSAAFLLGRAEVSASFALLLMLTTPWMHVLKAMRSLGVPVLLVALLGMTHRYVFVLLQTASQMFEARRSRLLAPPSGRMARQLVASTSGVLLGKALQLSNEVHMAMVSRGYRGEVYLLHNFHTRKRDWCALLLALALPLVIVWNHA
ncbi:cobalt ECF transporter T component CbiQ [Aquitalea pelogenes]|uniref:cobalt ECF transporter T component CbiQ n=1 Tax=Aquitalea pelogenes TaxID=1293573 RepID=UPI0007872325|nr:cobalt ECF transporter T component CbiQ [Aquitalea pelogenes]